MSITRSRFMPVRAGALCAMAGLLVLAACEARIPTAAELTSMDVAAAEKAVASSGGFSGRMSDADYFLNGEKMKRDELTKLDGRMIGSMTVVEGKAQGGRDTIFIVTRDKVPLLDSLANVGAKIRRAGSLTVGKDAGMVATEALRPLDAKPAIMIDDKISTESALAALREADIVSVNIMKPLQQAAAGGAYPDGLIAIETKMGVSSRLKVKALRASLDQSKPARPTSSARVEPAYQIDGVRATKAQFEALDARDIVTVDVLKDEAVATALSDDPAAVNGLVRISTKRAKHQ